MLGYKFADVSAILPNVEQLDIYLPEIHEINAKLLQAFNVKYNQTWIFTKILNYGLLDGF
ncbi:hypothetical protein J4436_02335 [Candidatus Woesearchaeota archaeon]|nr:hypothetical protein [Candidatus Woesearchaeota archaeon]